MSTDREREALERTASEERIVHEWSLAVRLYRRGTRLGRKIALAIADALEADGVTEADIDRLFILERIVAEADRNPFNPIGHVIEHVVPEARARGKAQETPMSTDREPLPVPGVGGLRWRHRGGGTYRVIATGLIEADLTPCVVYMSERDALPGGTVWVRPYAEFTDGRFTCIDGEGDEH